MDRLRSVSESQYHAIYPLKQPQINSPQSNLAQMESSSSLSSLNHTPNKVRKNSAKNSLKKVLWDYKFLGNIVTFKTQEAYGFIRSEQVTGDVFFSLHHLDMPEKEGGVDVESFLGKWVNFTIKDMGKKSMEARKVSMVSANTSVVYMVGRVMSWAKNGCLLQVTSGLGLKHLNNRLFAPSVETQYVETGLSGAEVTFKIHVDRNFRMEGRDVKKTEKQFEEPKGKEVVKTRKPRRRAVTEGTSVGSEEETLTEAEKLMAVKNLTSEEFSDELVNDVVTMDSSSLSALFDKQLKARLATLAQQPVGSKIVVAVIKRAAKLERNNVEEKITRMMMANFLDICSTKQGCAVLQAGLENFSEPNKVMLAEQLLELDTVDQFTDLWVQGSHIFSLMLKLLDESSLTMVAFALCGHYSTLACHIRHYKPLKSLLVSIVNTESSDEILPELEQDLVNLACNKFGHFVVSALIQNTSPATKVRLINKFIGNVATLSTHQVCHAVIVTALEEGTDSAQATFIEEVCTVSSNQADMAVIRLTKDRYGHLVVLAMLKVSRHKQVHNLIKASILCKQEDVVENEFLAKVLKTIKTEFHSRTAGNYSK